MTVAKTQNKEYDKSVIKMLYCYYWVAQTCSWAICYRLAVWQVLSYTDQFHSSCSQPFSITYSMEHQISSTLLTRRVKWLLQSFSSQENIFTTLISTKKPTLLQPHHHYLLYDFTAALSVCSFNGKETFSNESYYENSFRKNRDFYKLEEGSY